MAPTTIEFEAAATLVESDTGQVGEDVTTKNTERRHRKLLQYLTGIVTKICPSYLVKDRDDIVQTVLIRLNGKLDAVTRQIARCCRLIENDGESSSREVADLLKSALAQIEKAWDRKRAKRFKARLLRSMEWARGCDVAEGDALRGLEYCLAHLQAIGGKEVYSEVYIKKGVHWAIMDAKKKSVRLAEVSPEEREDGSSEWDLVLSKSVPGARNMVIREEISDCLRRLRTCKRRPTLLALLGYEYSEIAKFLDLSLPQADSRIRRGKAFLRKCLKSKGVSP